MSNIQRLLAALKSMSESVEFMANLPGSDRIPVDLAIVAHMEKCAKDFRLLEQEVRKEVAKIAADLARVAGPAPSVRKRFELN